jgi:acyl carrier protein
MLARTATIRQEIAEIFRDVFEYQGAVAQTTSPDDVDRWDSLQHIALVRAIEEMFQITLSMDEMMELDSAGAIEKLLRRHSV